MEIKKKLDKLQQQLRSLGKVLVAFSGGKDSFFLLQIALETLGKENVHAVFVETDLLGESDIKRLDYFGKLLDMDIEKIFIDVTNENNIMSNPLDRCYHCKKKIFSTLKRVADDKHISYVVDGTTGSDRDEYRPGIKALKECAILSPLEEAGITSAEIVTYLEKQDKLPIEKYYLTSSTCLATRFPYHVHLSKPILETFAKIEMFFIQHSIYPVRIRYIEEGIRIEVDRPHFHKILEMRDSIIRYCHGLGIKFITLDLEGLKSGSWDPKDE